MIEAVDLFCGAGGTSTGILKAARERLKLPIRLTAVNHWPTAINTHSLNHPEVRHICEPVENLWPPRVITSRKLDLLAASCECTFHSNARGGGPCNEQSRSQPWQLIRWATDIRVENILMENVREFIHWGPLHARTKRPIKSRRGEFFKSFVNALINLGYQVEWKIQVCADFGDATTRPRLILMARLGNPIAWPEPTHGAGRARPWRPFREHWDRSIKGKSIFKEDGSLRHCENTIRRMIAGFEKQGSAAEPFLMILRGTSTGHLNSSSRSINEPIPSLTANGNHIYLVEPFIQHLTHHGNDASRVHSLDEPLPTITGAHRGELCLVEPFIAQTDHQSARPESYVRSVDNPLPTIVSKQSMLIVQPMVMKYYKTGRCKSVDQPLDTVTTKARFMLVEPAMGKRYGLDILTRMVQPHELAACHSFPKHYQFTGTKADQTKQIGNSVPVEIAAAHAEAILKK